MSLFALPVTVDDMLDLQDCIQFFTNQAQATSQAAAINAGATTVYDYALQLLAANLATSQVAVAVPSLILNETPTVGVIENVTLNFLPDQIDFAVAQGLDPVVYAAEAWAVNVASSNAADFNALYGNLNSTQFAAVVSTTTGVNTDAILNFIANWQAFFSANPNAIPPNLDVTTASYAAAFGDAIGNALVDDSVFTEGVNEFAENALLTICTGQYVAGVAPGAIPQHTPLQGEQSLVLTVGVDHLTTSAPGAIFEAPAANNPPLGLTNTLNTGDTLVDTLGDGTLNFTAVDTLFANTPFALGVNMDGIATANILNLSEFDIAGFSGDINGLTELTVLGGSVDFGIVQVGAPGLGAGLHTALEQITINTNHEVDAYFDPSALTGAEALGLVLNNVEAYLFLDVNTGTTGYGELGITSASGPNILDGIETGFDTLATILVDGDQNLDLFNSFTPGDALNVATLDFFDATALTGDLFVDHFHGIGDLVALGGSGDDELIFWTDGAVAASGNDGDDILTWWTDFFDPTSFTAADSADGGDGDNLLRLEAYNGALLGAGVGPNIVNIQTIQHITFDGGVTADIDVDMGNSGSATNLDLAGDYNGLQVTVTNLTNADTVIYSGTELGAFFGSFLTLEHISPLGTYNLVLAAEPGGFDDGVPHVIGDMIVADGLLLNIESTGSASENVIATADLIDVNISITGDVDLTLGDFGFSYDVDGGIIDASTFEGDLTTFLGAGSQTLFAGLGDDNISVLTPSNVGPFLIQPDTVDISTGGADTVSFFFATGPDGGTLIPGVDYHHVAGFSGGDDLIEVDAVNMGLDHTDSGLPVVPGEAVVMFNYVNGTFVDLGTTGPFLDVNFIKFTTAVPSVGLGAEDVFEFAIGPAGGIIVEDFGDQFLMALYDQTNEQMLLFTATSDFIFNPFPFVDGIIDDGSDIDVVATVGMSLADFQAFDGTNLAFI